MELDLCLAYNGKDKALISRTEGVNTAIYRGI